MEGLPTAQFHPTAGNELKGRATTTELSNRDCINTYATDVRTRYGSLLLVADDFNSTYYDFALIGPWNDAHDPYNWMCTALEASPCSRMIHQVNPDNWTITEEIVEWVGERIFDPTTQTYPVIGPMTFRVRYCLAETVPERCTVEYSLPLVIIVVLVNLIKATTLWATTASIADSPILTMGDAIATFLRSPDATTHGESLLSRDNVLKPSIKPLTYCATPRRWGSSVSFQRWISCFLLYGANHRPPPASSVSSTDPFSFLMTIIVCIILLAYGISTINSGQNPWETGFGQLRLVTLIGGDSPTSLVSNTMIANTPQVVF